MGAFVHRDARDWVDADIEALSEGDPVRCRDYHTGLVYIQGFVDGFTEDRFQVAVADDRGEIGLSQARTVGLFEVPEGHQASA